MISDSIVTREMASGKALSLVSWISDRAIHGEGPFKSAAALAAEYLIDDRYEDNAARIAAMIRWESTKNFGTGFISGLGGLATMPATLPAGLGASWVVQARLAAAIAVIHGHDVSDERVRTMVLLSLIGNAAKEELKRIGVHVGNRMARDVLHQISGRLSARLNQAVGFRLISHSGQRGVVSLSKLVPVAGGVVGGLFDGAACRTVGWMADTLFAPGRDT